jgi:hypothetical protein
MNSVTQTPTIIPDRELEEKKTTSPEPPRIRCPQCGWSARKEDKWFCTCSFEWNTFDTGGVCPPRAFTNGLKLSAVPSMVGAFAVVHAVIQETKWLGAGQVATTIFQGPAGQPPG